MRDLTVAPLTSKPAETLSTAAIAVRALPDLVACSNAICHSVNRPVGSSSVCSASFINLSAIRSKSAGVFAAVSSVPNMLRISAADFSRAAASGIGSFFTGFRGVTGALGSSGLNGVPSKTGGPNCSGLLSNALIRCPNGFGSAA
ncbi:MAG: hypothetical protein QM811_30035 [Pirellulales bacterium]